MKYLLITLLLFSFISVTAQEKIRFVNVNGTSELILPADQINCSIQIKIIDRSMEESKKANDKRCDELIRILKESGISSNDIEISPIALGKNYEYENRQRIQKGFYAEVKVNFELKDLTKYYDLVDRITSKNDYEIVASGYSISDYEQKLKLVYEKALKAARNKAESMANTLNVKLGEVLEIDENNLWQNQPNPFNTTTQLSSQDGAISGKVSINRSIRVKFEIH
ncbi:MAG: SIMPL domain-containing protein [Ignavibacteriales bacterium]|nr:SIMPL domain-containing protein [Ignavibacteriales bacterium]